jgi:iron complex outermembrane receptor protein
MYYNAAYIKVNSLQITEHLIGEAADFPYLPSLFGNGTAASYVGYVPTFIET